MHSPILEWKTAIFIGYINTWAKQLLIMVTGEFFENKTKVSKSHVGLYPWGGLAHEGLISEYCVGFKSGRVHGPF